MTNDIVLNAALRSTITSINRTSFALERTSLRIATGLEVNSALDNPQNFFAAQALGFEAQDFTRLLDGIGQSIRTVQETLIGVKAISRLLEQSEAVASNIQERLRASLPIDDNETIEIDVSPDSLSTHILNLNPASYYRLDETVGPAATDGGFAGNDATYQGGVTLDALPLYPNGSSSSVDFNGIDGVVSIPNHAQINLTPLTQRSVELVFNADDVTPRQVLFEEGGTVNSMALYIENGRLYFAGRDQGDWNGSFNTPVTAGQTYHVAFVFDQPTNSVTGYLDGVAFGSATVDNALFPVHNGNMGIGGMLGSSWFHTGVAAGNGFYFNGRISDVAIHNTALSQAELARHVESLQTASRFETINLTFEKVLTEIDKLVIDANYRGINLLDSDNLVTRFNTEGTTYILTEGVDFTSEGLGLLRHDFDDIEDIDNILASIREARGRVENFGFSLSNDLSVITTRQDFTRKHIVHHKSGAEDLTVADLNEEGANMLAAQTRQDIAFSVLSFVSRAQASVLDLFTGAS